MDKLYYNNKRILFEDDIFSNNMLIEADEEDTDTESEDTNNDGQETNNNENIDDLLSNIKVEKSSDDAENVLQSNIEDALKSEKFEDSSLYNKIKDYINTENSEEEQQDNQESNDNADTTDVSTNSEAQQSVSLCGEICKNMITVFTNVANAMPVKH